MKTPGRVGANPKEMTGKVVWILGILAQWLCLRPGRIGWAWCHKEFGQDRARAHVIPALGRQEEDPEFKGSLGFVIET